MYYQTQHTKRAQVALAAEREKLARRAGVAAEMQGETGGSSSSGGANPYGNAGTNDNFMLAIENGQPPADYSGIWLEGQDQVVRVSISKYQ